MPKALVINNAAKKVNLAEKKRVLYISSVPLEDKMGGAVVMYYHLKQRDDLEVLEINNLSLQATECGLLRRTINAFWHRISRSRWHLKARRYEQLQRYQNLPNSLLEKARQFDPDIVLTVAHGNLFWLARNVAKTLRLPLASVYHDWWPTLLQQQCPLSLFDYERVAQRFQQLYHESDCVFCIAEGMREALGSHKNAYVLYPATRCHLSLPTPSEMNKSERFSLLYAGNVVASYGQRLRSLIRSQPSERSLKLIVHGNPHDWLPSDLASARQQDILKPFIDASAFAATLSKASALLTVISFDSKVAQLMSTNFPSKMATYALFGKPLIVWAPAYSTAAQLVRQYECGLLIKDPDPAAVWQAVLALSQDRAMQQRLAEKALQLYRDVLHSEEIHQTFVHCIQQECYERKIV